MHPLTRVLYAIQKDKEKGGKEEKKKSRCTESEYKILQKVYIFRPNLFSQVSSGRLAACSDGERKRRAAAAGNQTFSRVRRVPEIWFSDLLARKT